MKYFLSFVLFVSILSESFGQQVQTDSVYDPIAVHSPKKATIRSAIIPGWGQAYNEKYWKIPVIYAGFGICAYFIDWNTDSINYYSGYLTALTNNDTSVYNIDNVSSQALQENLDQHKRWRDLSYMSLAAVYVLNIIDANVDGHLYHFDVNEDLSLNWRPNQFFTDRLYSGLTLTLTFK